MYVNILKSILKESIFNLLKAISTDASAAIDRLSTRWKSDLSYNPIYPTPPLGQDMTQGQFLSGV